MKLLIVLSSIFVIGCASKSHISSSTAYRNSKSYQERSELSESFYKKTKNNFSEKQIQTLLKSKVTLAKDAKIAIVKLEHKGIDSGYMHYSQLRYSDKFTVTDNMQTQVQDFIKNSKKIKDVSVVPSFLMPPEISIPNLRDTAALMQANYLLLIKTNSRTDFKFHFFKENEALAIANMEIGIIDVKSGAIPFTSLITGKINIKKSKKEDFNANEFRIRARQQAEEEAFKNLFSELNKLFKSSTI